MPDAPVRSDRKLVVVVVQRQGNHCHERAAVACLKSCPKFRGEIRKTTKRLGLL
jgi:hypothetical protein